MEAQQVFFIESLGKLFEDVQQQKIFPDSKFFVDCIPKEAPAAVLASYLAAKDAPGFSLIDFVTEHFIFPVTTISQYSSGNKPILEHLEALWPVLTRHPDKMHGGTLIPLPHPYVVPGGRFREIYYWDSYFTMLGLQVSRQTEIMQHMVDNFAYLIDTFGFIPNGNRTYYLSRSQPPFFTLMVELLAEEKGSEVMTKYLPQIEKEYAFWMEGESQTAPGEQHRHVVRLPDGHVLNRYCDEKHSARPEAYREDSKAAAKAADKRQAHIHLRAACESGWDFSSRWLRNDNDMGSIQTAHLVAVDLNCLLLHMERMLAVIYKDNQNPSMAANFEQKAAQRTKALQQYCWNQQAQFYFDYHFIDGQQTQECTLAAAFPLFFKVASAEQAAGVAKMLQEKFLQQGGLVTTLKQSGQQWDFPNGWAPLQWIAYKGVKNYGHNALASAIKTRWMAANEHVYAHTGKMMEKYNVTDTVTKAGGGEYPNQDGFGWSNGVYLKMSSE